MRIINTISAFLLFVFTFCSCAQPPIVSVQSIQPIAFPTAEGFGKFTTGGRGGKLLTVTNLNDKGPGSFRYAAEANGRRIIVFAVSGTIHLQSKLNIKSDVTIAGQSAPGDGICIADHSVSLAGDNIIIRYMRFRLGDQYQNGGMKNGSGSDDALTAVRRKNIIIDHCSLSWSTDEVMSIYAGDSTTLQWNIISEPLNYSYHFETGDKDFEHHGYGGIWGGRHLTAHHNLFAHCNNRNPRFDGIRNVSSETVDYRNNVIYNWGTNTIYAGEGGSYNLVNNYFKYGPSTKQSVRFRIASPGRLDKPYIPFGKYYVSGNFVDGDPAMSANNHAGIVMANGGTVADKDTVLLKNPVPTQDIRMESATDAYKSVLNFAGANFKRDTLDERIVRNVRERTGGLIDVQGGYPHGTAYVLTVNAWPALKSAPAAADLDKDGMPDYWENTQRLDPTVADDAKYTLDKNKNFTNIEVYLNSIVL